MVWGMVAMAGASLLSGALSSRSARSATDQASRRSSDAAMAAEQRITAAYDDARARMAPYIQNEAAANRQLAIELGLPPPGGDAGGIDFTAQQQESQTRLAGLRDQLTNLQRTASGAGADDPANDIFQANTGDPQFQGGIDERIAGLQEQIAQEESAIEGEYLPAGGQPGVAYRSTPGYQGAVEAGTQAVNQGAAGGGSLYSGARGLALRDVGQGVEQSYYSNYMNMLQNMANPTATTNLSNIGIGQAGTIGAQNIASANQSNAYGMAGAQAQGAFMSDAMGGVTSAYGAYMGRQQPPPPAVQPTQPGVGANINQVDYTRHV